MKKTQSHKAHVLMLVAALIFGQIGSGFLHNKHDAHEAVIDLQNDAPVLLNHGEHCKVCAVDWVSQFLIQEVELDFIHEEFIFSPPVDVRSLSSSSFDLKSSRAPPILS